MRWKDIIRKKKKKKILNGFEKDDTKISIKPVDYDEEDGPQIFAPPPTPQYGYNEA